MEFLLVIHLLICAAMIGVVLLQKSEGGALGIGGGGGAGGFLTGRGTANLLTRITAGLAAGFFATSIVLSVFSGASKAPPAPFSTPAKTPPTQPTGAPKPPTGADKPGAAAKPGGLLDKLKTGKARERLPSVPQGN
jgi:preprotein translocase subunit SecG